MPAIEYWILGQNWVGGLAFLSSCICCCLEVKGLASKKQYFRASVPIFTMITVVVAWWAMAVQQEGRAPRHLTDDQKTEIIAMLKPYAKKVTVGLYWVYQDGDAHSYGEQWIDVIKQSNWDIIEKPPGSEAHGVVIQTKYLVEDMKTTDATKVAANIIDKAFKSVGVIPQWEPNEKDLNDNEMYIGIGARE